MPNPRGNAGPLNPWLKREWEKAFPYGQQEQPAPPSPWQAGPSASPWSGSAGDASGPWTSPLGPSSPPIDVPMEVMPKAKPSPWGDVGANTPVDPTQMRGFREADAKTGGRRMSLTQKLLPLVKKENPKMSDQDAARYMAGYTDAELEQLFKELGGDVTGGEDGSSNAPSRRNQGTYDKYGTDPNWIAAFEKKHEGNDPITQYMSGDNGAKSAGSALWEADWDRKWAERFARTYGRPPSDDDWKSSYYHRQDLKNGTDPSTGGGVAY